MAKKEKRFADDGWAVWVEGDDTGTVFIDDWINPKGKSYVDLAIGITGASISTALYVYVPFEVKREEIEDVSLNFNNRSILQATFSSGCIVDYMKNPHTSEIAYNGKTVDVVHISTLDIKTEKLDEGTLISLDINSLRPYLDNDEMYLIWRMPHKSLDEIFKASTNASGLLRRLSALPRTFPDDGNYRIDASMLAAKEVGGDFYDFYRLSDTQAAFLVADVSGKGIPAAMFMMTAKTVIKGLEESGMAVNEIFEKANDKLCENNESGMFVTCRMGVLNTETGVLSYANAGHNPPVIKRNGGGSELLRSAPGFVLGINTAIPYGIVRVGEGYGTVTELLDAVSVSKIIKNNPDDLSPGVKYYVDMLKSIHAVTVEDGDVPDMKETALDWAEFVSHHLPAELGQKLISLVSAVPKQNTLMHGDYHTNNVMVQNGEPVLIDMDTLCMGHPVFELGSMFNAFIGFAETNHQTSLDFLGYSFETASKLWDMSLKAYLGTEDEEYCRSVAEKAMIIGCTRMLRRAVRRSEDEDSPVKIARCKEMPEILIAKTDTLLF